MNNFIKKIAVCLWLVACFVMLSSNAVMAQTNNNLGAPDYPWELTFCPANSMPGEPGDPGEKGPAGDPGQCIPLDGITCPQGLILTGVSLGTPVCEPPSTIFETCLFDTETKQTLCKNYGNYGPYYRGVVTQQRVYDCQAQKWGDWTVQTQTCTPYDCTPGDTEDDTASCPAGYNGDQTRTRTCQANGTWGGWTQWDQSQCTPYDCTPGQTEDDTASCPAG